MHLQTHTYTHTLAKIRLKLQFSKRVFSEPCKFISKSYIILIAQLVCYGLLGSSALNISIGNIQSTFQTVCLILNEAMPQAMPIGHVASNALNPLHPIQCQLS